MHAESVTIENGFVLLPERAPWLADYLCEFIAFHERPPRRPGRLDRMRRRLGEARPGRRERLGGVLWADGGVGGRGFDAWHIDHQAKRCEDRGGISTENTYAKRIGFPAMVKKPVGIILPPDSNRTDKELANWTRLVATFTALLGICTLLLVVMTGLSAYFIYQQWGTMIQAQDDLRLQNSAYLTFTGGNQVVTEDKGQAINYFFNAVFHNWGNTRTAKLTPWASVKYFPGVVPQNMDFTKPESDIPAHVGISQAPGNSEIFVGPVAISRDDAVRAKNKEGVVIIWGQLQWSQIYAPDNMYTINFCLTLTPVSSQGDERIVFQPNAYKPECNTGMASTKS